MSNLFGTGHGIVTMLYKNKQSRIVMHKNTWNECTNVQINSYRIYFNLNNRILIRMLLLSIRKLG